MQTELTLQLDEDLIQRAKSFSEKSGKTVSELVAGYFALLDIDLSYDEAELTPVVRSLKGSLRGAKATEKDYRTYLEGKFL